MWWRRKRMLDQPDIGKDDVAGRLADASRLLTESEAGAVRARKIAEESRRLVQRNSISKIVRDSIVHPQ